MKKLFKITSLVLAGLLFVSLIFGAGVYASQNWLKFTGDEQIKKSESDIDKIMQILEDVNSEKMTAEQALKELQGLNPAGLAKQNTELRQQVEQLKTDNGVLTTEVANQKQQVVNKQAEIEQKQQEIQDKIEEGNRKVAEKQTELKNSNSYVEHLEEELRKANEAAQSVSNKTTEALTKAQGYVDQE